MRDFGFFANNSNYKNGVIAVNTVAFGYAVYKMYADPSTMWEEGFDAAGHAITLMSLVSGNGFLRHMGSYSINLMNLGAVYAEMTSGASGRPLPVNATDALLHVLNLGTNLYEAISAPDTSTTAKHS